MKVQNFTIGADPELFLEKNGSIISAEGIIGGTKHEPKPISDNGHAIQEDNVMVEFNIPPSNSVEEFVDNINYVKDHLNTLCSIKPGMKLNYSVSHEFDPEVLKSEQASTFGCEPSFNAYLKKRNPRPSSNTNWRSCGGHIHIGYDNPDHKTTELIIFAMDMVLGLQSLSMDSDTIRKKSYGKAGEFRFKPFGCEYRVLSNFWIENDDLITWAYESTAMAIDIVNSDIIYELINKYSKSVKKAIDTMNKDLANDLLTKISNDIEKVKINNTLILK